MKQCEVIAISQGKDVAFAIRLDAYKITDKNSWIIYKLIAWLLNLYGR